MSRKWQRNPKITPRKATQHERTSPNNNENTEDEEEATAVSLTGLVLTQCTCIVQFVASLRQTVQFSWATPKTVEAWSFVLWEMVNRTTNTLDRLRILANTLRPWPQTLPNRYVELALIENLTDLLLEIVEEFDL